MWLLSYDGADWEAQDKAYRRLLSGRRWTLIRRAPSSLHISEQWFLTKV